MKKRIFIIATAVLATAAMFTACSNDELEQNQAETPKKGVTFQVVDNGLQPTGEAPVITRAYDPASGITDSNNQSQAYKKQFTEGDEIGIFVIRNGEFIGENVHYKMQADGSWRQVDENGDVTAEQLSSLTEEEYTSTDVYFAYYPYQAELEIGDGNLNATVTIGEDELNVKDRNTTGLNTTDETTKRSQDEAYAMAFFKNLIARWNPAQDQETYLKYTAQDLMVACGTINNNNVVIFRMYHQMALVVLNLSKNQPSGGSGKQYYTVANYRPWNIEGNLWRLIVIPLTQYYITGARYNNNTASKIKLGTWQVHITADDSEHEGTPEDPKTCIEHGHYKVYNDTNAL